MPLVLGMMGCLLLEGCGGRPAKGPKQASQPGGPAKSAFDQGKKHLAAENRQKALAAFTQAIRAAPDYQQAYVWRGVAHCECGDLRKALADFTKGIELDPTDNYALQQRAAVYRRLGESAKAKADDDRAEQLREKNREDIRERIKGKKRPDK